MGYRILNSIAAVVMAFLEGIFLLIYPCMALSAMPDFLTGVYLPPQALTERYFKEIEHYYTLSNMNAVVIHVKDPLGRIYWNSGNALAREIGAVTGDGDAEKALSFFKNRHIWVIAKMDVFQDTLLACYRPEWAVMEVGTERPWKDNHEISWINPYKTEAWDYILSLGRELADLGFDEIQFDYVRFPSDGALNHIRYPDKPVHETMAECISRFFEAAYTTLKPQGVTISADVFGLTAWKHEDFGVGQVIESITPYTDVICPMFYPSHFPVGFRGFSSPSDHPKWMMENSTRILLARTNTRVRPWIQGFWYSPREISLQLDGLSGQPVSGWMVWHSSADYRPTFDCMSDRLGIVFPTPVFYPSLEELRPLGEKVVQGGTCVVNHTDYVSGTSVLRIEPHVPGSPVNYSTPVSVVNTLDESILDRLLTLHGISFGPMTVKTTKSLQVAGLLCRNLGLDPQRIRPMSIQVTWGTTGNFKRISP